jgi:hypothetical protein
MKLIHAAVAIGVAAWAMTRAMRTVDRDKRAKHKEAVTRWEGEGGSIPDVDAERQTVAYRRAAS